MSNQLLTRQEAADRVALSLRSFERWIQPHLKLVRVGAAVRVPETEIVKWIEREMRRAA